MIFNHGNRFAASAASVLAAVLLFGGLSDVFADADLVIKSSRQVVEQEVGKTGGTFRIQVAGAADPVMRRLEIVGPVVDPKVTCDGWVDFETPQTTLKSILRPRMTERDKALAIFRFGMESFSANAPFIWDEGRFACALGFGHCGPRNNAQTALCNAAGIRWMNLGLPHHNGFQYYYDKKWHVMDSFLRILYPTLAGDDIADVDELTADPGLITRSAGADWQEMNRSRYPEHLPLHTAEMVKVYTTGKGRTEGESGKKFEWDNNRIRYVLRSGERIIFWWDRRQYLTLWEGEPKIQPWSGITDTTNPQLIYEPDLGRREAQEDLKAAKNISWRGGELPLGVTAAGEDAAAVWEFSSYYNVMTGSVEGEFYRSGPADVLTVSASIDGGRTWQIAWEHAGQGLVKEKIDLGQKNLFVQKCFTRGLRSYQVRIAMKAAKSPQDIGAGKLRFVSELLAANPALPALRRGKNTITVTATSAPRPFKVIYTYDETSAITADRYDPIEDTPVKISAVVANCGKTAATGTRVQFYDGDPAGTGEPIGEPVIIPAVPAGKTSVAELSWNCTPTGNRGPYYSVPTVPQLSKTKPFYYCHSDIYALINPGAERLAPEVTAELPRLQLYIRQKPNLPVSEPFILVRAHEQLPKHYRVRAVIRNICVYEKWVYVRGTTVKNVVVRFFDDGVPGQAEDRQIGKDQVVPALEPLGFTPVEVVWNAKGLPSGKRIIRVVVDPDKKITERDMKTPNSATKEFELK